MRGPFIAIEGPEGGGKSLQAARLAATLEAEGWRVLLTREPGGTALGDALRTILLGSEEYGILPEAETLLLAAGRAQHVRERILPVLEAGGAVICDRFVDSTLAYQGGGHGLAREQLLPIQNFATGGLEPDLRVLIDVPVEVGLRRRHADPASVNRIDRKSRSFHDRVRTTFLELAAARPDAWSVVDGQEDADSVEDAILRSVTSRVLAHYASPAHVEKP